MDYLLGVLTAVAFFLCVGGCLFIGYKFGQRKTKVAPDDDSKREAQELQKAFVKLMNYDVNTALQPRKKV